MGPLFLSNNQKIPHPERPDTIEEVRWCTT